MKLGCLDDVFGNRLGVGVGVAVGGRTSVLLGFIYIYIYIYTRISAPYGSEILLTGWLAIKVTSSLLHFFLIFGDFR